MSEDNSYLGKVNLIHESAQLYFDANREPVFQFRAGSAL